MKALVMKDCFVLWRQIRLFVFIMAVICVFNGSFGSVFITIWAAMMPYTAMAYDEQSKWDQMAVMMPYSVRDIVLSKYVLGWLCTGAAGCFVLLIQLIVRLLRLPLEAGTLSSVFTGFCGSIVVLSVALPLMVRFGVEKGRLMMFVLIFLVCGGTAGLVSVAEQTSGGAWALPLPVMVLMPLAAAASAAISVPLSVKLYQHRS